MFVSPAKEEGIGALIALIALSIFSVIGLYVALNATTSVRISDNYESEVQASYAARAGINHAREILRGLRFDDLLKGPDGTYTTTTSYLAQARTYGYRTLVSFATARSMNILDPSGAVAGLPDDGLINTGHYASTNGTILIPTTGIPQTVPNPYGSGNITVSRYFVKVTDNNGEPSEIAKDSTNNPFIDGDGIILVRSIGVARTVREVTSGGTVRSNSVAVVEARFKERSTFKLDAPLLVEGNAVQPSAPGMFNGNSFHINGGANAPGIATIDVDTSDAIAPYNQIRSQLAVNQYNNIQGNSANPSMTDITGAVTADVDKSLLLSPAYLYDFVHNVLPRFADNVYNSNQNWSGGSAPDIGTYDISLPPNDPAQHPKATLVNGDLSVSGNITGGGLLVITGKFWGSGHFMFNGLVLIIGAGDADMSGMNLGINGGMYIVHVEEDDGEFSFGIPKLTVSGNSDILINSDAIDMGVRLIPPAQMGWREINSSLDP